MKITRIALESFRSHLKTELSLAPFTVIRGGNHVGKSSIEQALQLALAGRSQSTDQRGAGAKDLIRPGADKAVIYLDICDGTVGTLLRCTLSAKGGRSIAAKDEAGANITPATAEWLKANADIFSCLLNSRYFVDLRPDDQKALLAAIVLPDTHEWEPWVKDAASGAGLMLDYRQRPFEFIASSYALAFAARREANVAIRDFVFPNGDITEAGETGPIEAKLKDLRGEAGRLEQEKQKRQSAIANRAQNLQGAERRVTAAEEKIRTEETRLTEQRGKLLSKEALAANKKTAALARTAAEIGGRILGKQSEIEAIGKEMTAVSGLGECCPTCRQAITAEVVQAIAQPMVDRKNKATDELRELRQERAGIGDFSLAQQAIDDHKSAESDAKRIDERIREARTELAAAQEDVEALQNKVFDDPAELDPQIHALEERITVGTQNLGRTSAANERKKAQAEASKRHEDLRKKQAGLEKLVAYFGADGVQAELLSKHVGGFRESINAVLAQWGYRCFLSFEPYSFGISTESAAGELTWDLRLLSDSENFRFAIAFQVALAEATGFRFVVIDRADMLDTEDRKRLFKLLYTSKLDQTIVIGTDERYEVPSAKDSAFYMLTAEKVDGVVTTTAKRLQAGI